MSIAHRSCQFQPAAQHAGVTGVHLLQLMKWHFTESNPDLVVEQRYAALIRKFSRIVECTKLDTGFDTVSNIACYVVDITRQTEDALLKSLSQFLSEGYKARLFQAFSGTVKLVAGQIEFESEQAVFDKIIITQGAWIELIKSLLAVPDIAGLCE